MAILFNSHLCKHWILYEDRDSLCPITTKALAFRRKELFDVLHPTTRHIAYMNNGTLLPIEIMS